MLNLVRQHFDVSRAERASLMGHQPLVVWFTGLSGSGKSTLANALASELHQRKVHTYSLDGDNIRLGLNRDLGFSESDRSENLRRIGEVAKLMTDAGLVVTTSFITPLNETRRYLRNLIPDYFEVYVSCPLEICEQRDAKGLYAKARRGEILHFTGISAPFETPESPDLVLETDKIPLDDCLGTLLHRLLPRIQS
jgi:adenylylsulfate kinase